MKVVYTEEALADLKRNCRLADPSLSGRGTGRRATHPEYCRTHRARPESSRRSAKRPGVHVVTLGHYPYRIFYRVAGNMVEMLHIHHAARQPWDERT